MTDPIVLAIPSGRDGWKRDFCMSVIGILSHRYENGEIPLHTYNETSSNLLQNRHKLVRAAMKARASHILWMDDDMSFPSNSLERLLSHDKPIVAANYTTRQLPCVPLAVKNGKRILSKGRHGMEEIDHLGMGLMLTHLDVFKKSSPPWFMFFWDDEYPDNYGTEDVWFCRKAKKAGFRIWIDHTLSNEVRHLGNLDFGHEYTEEAE